MIENIGFFLLVQGIIFGVFCAYIAGQKGREKGPWFFAGLFFSLIALIAAAAVPVERRDTLGPVSSRVKFSLGDECLLTQKMGIYGEGTRVKITDIREIKGQIVYKIVTLKTSIPARFDVTEKALRRMGEQTNPLNDNPK
jgi:hypothetical protein